LELPATGWVRRYRVRAYGRIDEAALKHLAKGATIDGIRYGPVTAELERKTGANSWLRMGLSEGKNREVRKLLASLGLEVTRLIRISFGPFQLGRLEPGAVDEVPGKSLSEQLGGLMPKSASLPPTSQTAAPKKALAPREKLKLKPKAAKGGKARSNNARHRRTS
jgi:23S rRNA pseudouridine2605 synthase